MWCFRKPLYFQLQEFTAKIQSSVPKAPKKESDGKTDFKTAKELVDYIIDEGKTQTNVQESWCTIVALDFLM